MRIIILALSLAVATAASAQKQSEPERLARAALAALDAHDLTKFGTLLDDSFTIHFQGAPDAIPKKDFIGMLGGFLTTFPDMRHDILMALPGGDYVTMTAMFHGTQRGEYAGVPATGKDVAQEQMHIAHVVNGKIVEWWAAEDELSVLRQIGMVIQPPSSTSSTPP